MERLNNLLLQCLLLGLLLASLISAATDKTLVEKEKGRHVVDAVVNKIRSSKIFVEDYQFLRRIAYVETLDGESNSTYAAPTNYAGIWNVAEVYFNRTKDAKLASFHTQISSSFSIDWAATTWNDLLKPFYNGLAARLYLQWVNKAIPQTVKEQAWLWDQNYNRHDDWGNSTFVNRTEEFDNATVPCTGKMDLVIVLDGSESVTYPNFEFSKRFVLDLIGTYPIDKVRHGLVVFGSEAVPVFPLDNYMTLEELKTKALNVPYPSSKTNTNDALLEAYHMFVDAEPRPSVPQAMVILTDGISNPKGVDNIQLLKDLDVSSYAVGVTTLVDLAELEELAYNIPANVYTLYNFEVLVEFYKRMNAETCRVPQKPELDTPIDDTVSKGEIRYYSFSVPDEGITISRNNIEGSTTGYYSFDVETPNSALNDGVLSYAGTYIVPQPSSMGIQADGNSTVYIGVEGLEAFNNYTIEAIVGDSTEKPTTQQTTEPGEGGGGGGATAASITFGLLLVSIVFKFMADL